MKVNTIVVRRLHLPLREKGKVLAADPKAIVRNTMTMLEAHRPGVWSAQDAASANYVKHGHLIECLLDLPNNHFVLRMKITKPEGLPGGEDFVACPNFQLEYTDAQGNSWGDVLTSIYAVHSLKAFT